MSIYECRWLLDWCECTRSADEYLRRLVAASLLYNVRTRIGILALVAWMTRP